MRIIMVTPCYYPAKGGTETVVRNLSISLNRNGINTDILTFNTDQRRIPAWQGKTEKTDGFTVYKIPALNLRAFLHDRRFTNGINFLPSRFTNIINNYDIIHFHEAEFSFPLFSFMVKKPKILHFHGIDFQFLRRYQIFRTLLKHLSDYYISISLQMTQELLSLNIKRDKIFYLPNGVDTNVFKPQEKKKSNLLLFVGRVTANKGVHVLVKALHYLEKPVTLIIIGPMDNNYSSEILGLIKRENYRGKHKIFYLGAMNNEDIVKWYQTASLFILPSFAEGFPMTILEALSCETPVIATPVGGIPEIVKDSTTGILTPRNNPVALAQRIQYLLENKKTLTSLGRQGRDQVIKQYSLDASVKKLCDFYKHLTI